MDSRIATDEVIRVHVNNRTGTKTTIICAPSDTIANFKEMIGHQLGLRAEDILLKRQGERPLKGDVTLQDYEVADGSSLDLELDTGD